MTETLGQIGIGLVAGVVLGIVVFGGLKFTVDRLPTAKRPAVFAMTSLVVRMAVLCAVMVVVARSFGWVPLVASLPAMIAVRQTLIARNPEEPA